MRPYKWSVVGAVLLAMTLPAAAQSDTQSTMAAALTRLTDSLGSYLVVLAGTGALVVALLEAFKKLFSIRGKYHRTAVMRWLAQHSGATTGKLELAKPGGFSMLALGGGAQFDVPEGRRAKEIEEGKAYSAEDAYAEFFHLTSGQAKPTKEKLDPSAAVMRWRSVDRAVFELETSRMMSQVQDAADAVLNNPAMYPHLYAFLTSGVDGTDAKKWAQYMRTPPAGGATKELADLYGRIKMLVKRKLDAFQTVTSCRWEDLNQWWAMLVGALLLFLAMVVGMDPDFKNSAFDPLMSLKKGWAMVEGFFYSDHADKAPVLGLLFKAAFGGVLSPLAKDLLNSISSIKFSK